MVKRNENVITNYNIKVANKITNYYVIAITNTNDKSGSSGHFE